MPPLAGAPAHGGEKGGGSGGRHGPRAHETGRRSASFHGRSGAEQQHHQLQQQKRRPKTMPDLLAGARGGGAAAAFRSGSGSGSGSGSPSPPPDALGRRTPSKVLVSVAVQGSMWPLHVMAAAEWGVADLVAAAVAAYVKEGRRPPLPSADPGDFGLHYSQFSLESLDPKEKVMELGSRSFFLCPKSSAVGLAASSSSSDAAGGVITPAPGKAPAWLSNMQFWPMM